MRQLPSLSPVLHAVIRANRTRAALPDLERTALAFPLPGPDGMRWMVWLTPSEINPDTGAVRVGAPAYSVAFRADFGSFSELSALSPKETGAPENAGPWLGEMLDAAERDMRRPRFFELLQLTTPSFAAGPRALTPEAKQAAAELKTLLPEVAEPPLLPFYKREAKRFFAWLDLAAAP